MDFLTILLTAKFLIPLKIISIVQFTAVVNEMEGGRNTSRLWRNETKTV